MIGFKLSMGDTFGRLATTSTGAMLEAFEVVAPTGKRISLHAEIASVMARRKARMRDAGRTGVPRRLIFDYTNLRIDAGDLGGRRAAENRPF